ncbi:MAG: hypothetical protein EP343_27520 [Deltaproteobacteria bacterium]|nr:MAG: hypothetical protein EP343_27520 [Deltaproteobacteria bacterium]
MTDAQRPAEEEDLNPRHRPFEDDEAYEKRKRMARLVAFIGLAAFIVWGASWLQRAFPHRVELRYVYRDVPQIHNITQVEAKVHDDEGTKAQVVFYHNDPITHPDRYHRTQNLKLAKGSYQVSIVLHYKDNARRRLNTVLQVREAGRYYVYLKRAR